MKWKLTDILAAVTTDKKKKDKLWLVCSEIVYRVETYITIMCTESDQTAINRASCFLNMNDTQNQNNFDFVPKSDYNEKWHLENKCLFHNQQVNKRNRIDMINVLLRLHLQIFLSAFSFPLSVFLSLHWSSKSEKFVNCLLIHIVIRFATVPRGGQMWNEQTSVSSIVRSLLALQRKIQVKKKRKHFESEIRRLEIWRKYC